MTIKSIIIVFVIVIYRENLILQAYPRTQG